MPNASQTSLSESDPISVINNSHLGINLKSAPTHSDQLPSSRSPDQIRELDLEEDGPKYETDEDDTAKDDTESDDTESYVTESDDTESDDTAKDGTAEDNTESQPHLRRLTRGEARALGLKVKVALAKEWGDSEKQWFD